MPWRAPRVILLLILLMVVQEGDSSGYLEVQILEMSNYLGARRDGCCGGGLPPRPTAPCLTKCQTFFRLCLKEYQSNVTSAGSCSFGNASSSVIGGNSFTLTNPSDATLRLHFTFRWTKTRQQWFYMWIAAWLLCTNDQAGSEMLE
ncbi:hypothetical protein GE061_001320 [Apolygus lucorum]|uniref:Notch ligand N-terminal domain-containing protein n=1 Tax=Apolygus lucorum TaxID=248454 RepID=A0A6A4J1N9_APOLU|nr:hypothetical protein GE061_001320 [Apolygus lucorum]